MAIKNIILLLLFYFVVTLAKSDWKKTAKDNIIAGVASEGLDYIVEKYPPKKSVFKDDPILKKAEKVPLVGSFIKTVKNAAIIGEKIGEQVVKKIKDRKNK